VIVKGFPQEFKDLVRLKEFLEEKIGPVVEVVFA